MDWYTHEVLVQVHEKLEKEEIEQCALVNKEWNKTAGDARFQWFEVCGWAKFGNIIKDKSMLLIIFN